MTKPARREVLLEAHALAKGVLIAALGGPMKLRRGVAAPSKATGRPVVIVPVLQAAKARPFRQFMDSSRKRVVGTGCADSGQNGKRNG